MLGNAILQPTSFTSVREGERVANESVLCGMGEAASLVKDGDRVVYCGYMKLEPVALFHELLRQGRRDLHLVLAPSSGFVADLMIGAGALADVEFSSLSLMEYGFAPNFRRHAESGSLRYREHS
jgi:glutaconate CoA-transferase subunit A